MKLSKNVAFALHEQWRQTRLNKDGSYEPRWKKINDEEYIAQFKGNDLPSYVRKTENGYEIDIANACFSQLSADWQNENKAAAEVVAKIVEDGKQLSRDEIGYIIHKAWLERNSWAKDGKLGVNFTELPKEEQDKDLDQYDTALTMSNAKVWDLSLDNLDSVVKFLIESKKNGINASYEFNGQTLYSAFDTPDTCFLKVYGMTQKQLIFYIKNSNKNLTEGLKQEKILQWKKRGEAIIYPERKEDWFNCVEGRAKGLYDGRDLVTALEVMEALEEGKTIKEATKIIEKEEQSGSSWSMIMKIVAEFSKQGPAFYRANNNYFNAETEAYLQKLEKKNKLFGAKLKKEPRIDN